MKMLRNIKVSFITKFCIKIRVLILLYRVWKRYPDLRFYQLIYFLHNTGHDHYYEGDYWTTLQLNKILDIGISSYIKEIGH